MSHKLFLRGHHSLLRRLRHDQGWIYWMSPQTIDVFDVTPMLANAISTASIQFSCNHVGPNQHNMLYSCDGIVPLELG